MGSLYTVCRPDALPWDSRPSAKARINIPNLTVLKGVRLHTAFVTLQASAPSGIKSISNTFTFTIL